MPLVAAPTVPLLTTVQVVAFASGDFDMAAVTQRVAVSRRFSERAFCIRMLDDGMSPLLLRSDLVVVDPLVPVEPCSAILAVLSPGHEEPKTMVREIRFEKAGGRDAAFQLSALKKGYPTIWVNRKSNVEVVGSVVEVIRQLSQRD